MVDGPTRAASVSSKEGAGGVAESGEIGREYSISLLMSVRWEGYAITAVLAVAWNAQPV